MSVALRIQKVFFWGVTSAASSGNTGPCPSIAMPSFAIIRPHWIGVGDFQEAGHTESSVTDCASSAPISYSH